MAYFYGYVKSPYNHMQNLFLKSCIAIDTQQFIKISLVMLTGKRPTIILSSSNNTQW